jgi:hypothetical protein
MREPALALRIESDGAMGALELPTGADARRTAVRAAVGGPTIAGRYPRVMGPLTEGRFTRGVMIHVHDDGEGEGLAFNPSAWALLSGWLGQQLPHGVFGRVIITAYDGDGGIEPLPIDLMEEAGRARQVIRNVLAAQAGQPLDVDATGVVLVTAVRQSLTAHLN